MFSWTSLCRNMWARHVSGQSSVVDMYDTLVKKNVIFENEDQRQMAEMCTPLIRLIQETANDAGNQQHTRTGTPYSFTSAYSSSSSSAKESTSRGAAFWQGVSSAAQRHWQAATRGFRKDPGNTVEVMWPQNVGVQERRGLYLWGGVGIGKTLILDLFDLVPTGTLRKRRVHLHSFMTELSDRLHAATMKQMELEKRFRVHKPIDIVVEEILAEASIMCFDEFQTFDVAHAALLAAFFSRALQRGMFLIATSNRPPEELCHVSMAFDRLLPVLYTYCVVYACESQHDFRKVLSKSHHGKVFLCRNTRQNAERLLRRVERGFLTNVRREGLHEEECAELELRGESVWRRNSEIWLYGRPLFVPFRHGGVALFDFSELCGVRQLLGPPDFQLIAKTFHTIVVTNVPQIGVISKNVAKQFIILIDELYQFNVKLLFTCQVPWDHILDERDYWTGSASDPSDNENYYTDNADERSGFSTSFTFQNMEESLSFERIASRLHEMGMEHYLLRDHTHFVITDFRLSSLCETVFEAAPDEQQGSPSASKPS